MRLAILGVVFLTCAATAGAAQSAAKPNSTAQQKPQTITVTGCVAGGATAADPFTLTTLANPPASGAPSAVGAVPPLGTTGTGGDANAGATTVSGYRLSGTSVKPYVG